MAIVSEKNIEKISFLYAIIVVGVMTFATGGMFIFKKINTLQKDLLRVEQEFISQQKSQLKKDVESIVTRVDARRLATGQLMQERLERRVTEVQEMALGIYREMNGQFTEQEIGRVIREVIRPIRFNDDLGYFFILKLDGEAVLYPMDPGREGQNFIAGRVGDGPGTVKSLIDLAQDEGSGFLRYSWTRPGDDSGGLHKKVSYVSYFQELGWVIGTGEYLENLNRFTKKIITRDLTDSLNALKTDYYFVYDLHNKDGGKDFATMLINNNRPDLVGKKVSDDYVDVKGKAFRKDFLEGIRDSGESFIV